MLVLMELFTVVQCTILSKGLKERGFAKLGKILAVIFAILCIGASFGGGNAAQSNQAALQMVSLFGLSQVAQLEL